MKKIIQKLLMLAVVGSLGFLYSCGDEETLPDLPTVNATTDKTSYSVGEEVEISIVFTTPGKFSGFNYAIFVDGTQSGSKVFNSPTDIPGTSVEDLQGDFTLVLSNITPLTIVGSTVSIEFEVVDRENQIGTDEVEFSVTSPTARSYSAVLLAAPLGDISGKNFFASSNGTVYSGNDVTGTVAAVSPLIDFGYYYGVTNLASIASPKWFETSPNFSAQVNNWGVKNETKMRTTTLNATSFNEASSFAAIDAAFSNGTTEAQVKTSLTVGTVVAFETAGGKRGLVLVKNITGTDGSNGRLEIDVKVQETAN